MSRENALENDASEKTEADEKRAFNSRHRAFKPGEDEATDTENQQKGDRHAGLKTAEDVSEAGDKRAEGEADLESKKGFANDERLQDHFDDHAKEFEPPFATKDDYEGAAKNFMHGDLPDGALEKTRPGGDRVRYNPDTEEFGVASKDDVIRTYYKPDPEIHKYPTNRDYFDAQ